VWGAFYQLQIFFFVFPSSGIDGAGTSLCLRGGPSGKGTLQHSADDKSDILGDWSIALYAILHLDTAGNPNVTPETRIIERHVIN
jgi:hypothetical protein